MMIVLPDVPLHAMGYFLEVRDVVIPSIECGSNMFYPLPFLLEESQGCPLHPASAPWLGPRGLASALRRQLLPLVGQRLLGRQAF